MRRPAGMDDQAPGGSAGPQPGRRHHAAQRREQVVGEVAQEEPPLAGVRDRPEHAQQPCVIERVLAGAGPADDVDEGQGDGRCRDRTTTRHRPSRRGPGLSDQTAPACASTSRPSAARAAAMRSAAPSPATSAHGAMRSSRNRSRRRCRSDGTVDHTRTPSTMASSGSSGATAAAGTTASRRRLGDAPGRWHGARPDRGVVTEDDRLDPAIQDVGQGLRRRPDGAPRIVGGQGELEQEGRQRIRRGVDVGDGRRREQEAAGSGRRRRRTRPGPRTSPRPG